jgi:hypothetical protein
MVVKKWLNVPAQCSFSFPYIQHLRVPPMRFSEPPDLIVFGIGTAGANQLVQRASSEGVRAVGVGFAAPRCTCVISTLRRIFPMT